MVNKEEAIKEYSKECTIRFTVDDGAKAMLQEIENEKVDGASATIGQDHSASPTDYEPMTFYANTENEALQIVESLGSNVTSVAYNAQGLTNEESSLLSDSYKKVAELTGIGVAASPEIKTDEYAKEKAAFQRERVIGIYEADLARSKAIMDNPDSSEDEKASAKADNSYIKEQLANFTKEADDKTSGKVANMDASALGDAEKNASLGNSRIWRQSLAFTPNPFDQDSFIKGGMKTINGISLNSSDFGANSLDAFLANYKTAFSDPKTDPNFSISRRTAGRAYMAVSQNWERGGDVKTTTISNFILVSASESKAEAYRIIETFGESVFYSMGQSPVVANFRGELLSSRDQAWKDEFEKNYDQILRAEKCIESNSRVYIMYDNKVVEGLILNFNTSTIADSPNSAPFSFSMFVTKKAIIGGEE